MGLFEKTVNNIEERQPSRFRFWVVLIIGQVAFWYVIGWAKDEDLIQNKLVWFITFGVYLILALIMRPKPDYSNMGWLKGLIDNPFRFKDDINRMSVLSLIILYPGRVMIDSFIYLLQLIASFFLYLFKDVKI